MTEIILNVRVRLLWIDVMIFLYPHHTPTEVREIIEVQQN